MAELINKLDLLEIMALSHKAHANNSREASLLDRDLRIVLEQPATIEEEIRNKAISEFAEALCSRAEEESIEAYFPDGLYGLVVEIENLKDMVGKIADQMKGAVQ